MSDERPEQMSDYMESLAGSLAPAAISGWLKKLAEHARELCPESGVEFKSDGNFGDIAIPTKEGRRCVIESIKAHEAQAPELIKTILAAYRSRLEQQM